MKAFKEIGLRKTLRFVFFEFIQLIIGVLFIPQLRVFFLRMLGANIGKNCLIYNVTFMNLYRGTFSNLIIGDSCFIGNDVVLDLAGKITIGDNVTISNRCFLLTHMNVGYKNHPLQKVLPSFVSEIVIKNGIFLGLGTIILPGIVINNFSIVGAGTVVTKDINSFKVVAGMPGRVIRSYEKKLLEN